MNKIAIITAKRSAIGKIPGELNYINETELIATIFKAVTTDLPNTKIDEALLGSSFPIERDNLCRKAILKAGLPSSISAATISKTCASSDEALLIACNKIWSGTIKTALVGGVEKVGNSPYTLHFMKQNIKRSVKGDLPYFKDIENNFLENDMVYICEKLSKTYNISRRIQDDFTIRSINKALKANLKGNFQTEIVPIIYKHEDLSYQISSDEMLLYDRNESDIYNVMPMFLKDGTITQYNAAPMNECATAMLIMDLQEARRLGLEPMAWIVDTTTIGVPDYNVGEAMPRCVSKLLNNNHLSSEDIDLYEINESFAAQAIHTINCLKLDTAKVNVNGGNLALGYPIGTTGLRMNISLLYEMLRRKVRFGLSVMCAGGYMANATLLENSYS